MIHHATQQLAYRQLRLPAQVPQLGKSLFGKADEITIHIRIVYKLSPEKSQGRFLPCGLDCLISTGWREIHVVFFISLELAEGSGVHREESDFPCRSGLEKGFVFLAATVDRRQAYLPIIRLVVAAEFATD